MEPWSPYRIRHAVVTDVAEQADMETARVVAGHDSVKTTRGYVHQDAVKKAKAASALRKTTRV